MSRVRAHSIMVVTAVGLLWAPAVMAQTPDFAVSAIDSADPVAPGATVTYTFTLANNGDAATVHLPIVDFDLPLGIPANVADFSAGDQGAIEAVDALLASIVVSPYIWADPPSTGAELVWAIDTNHCESWIFQIQGLILPAGSSGDVGFSFPAPASVTEGVLAVSSANLRTFLNYGRGACADGIEDCTGTPCMGPRVSTIDAITEDIELVDDGSGATSSLGCLPLQNFTPGNIALVDRGTCTFETKALNGVIAGASAVIIADNGGLPDGNDIISMACIDFCSASIITVPIVFISTNDGLAIHADLGTGVMGTIGAREVQPPVMTAGGFIWEWDGFGNAMTDPNQGDNTWDETTLVSDGVVFADGFESGNTGAWSGP